MEDIVLYLSATAIAHFGCHRQQHAHNPLESTLIIYDGQLKVSQMMQPSMPNASLVFLSGCKTAMGDQGFHRVFATLW